MPAPRKPDRRVTGGMAAGAAAADDANARRRGCARPRARKAVPARGKRSANIGAAATRIACSRGRLAPQSFLGTRSSSCLHYSIWLVEVSSPASDNVAETLSSLQFATRCKDVRSSADPRAAAATIADLKAEVKKLREGGASVKVGGGHAIAPRGPAALGAKIRPKKTA